jgi:hypothetical protein
MAKKVNNPDGKKGGEKHQAAIKKAIELVEKQDLLARTEFMIATPNGKKKKRFIDVVGLDSLLQLVFPIQAGKARADGKPVKREQEAIEDIENETGLKITFINYEKNDEEQTN